MLAGLRFRKAALILFGFPRREAFLPFCETQALTASRRLQNAFPGLGRDPQKKFGSRRGRLQLRSCHCLDACRQRNGPKSTLKFIEKSTAIAMGTRSSLERSWCWRQA